MDDLNDKRVKNNESSGKLLGPQEKLILERIAAGEPPHSQRAHSLLAIDAGVTHKIAALNSGQTVGQVGYWLGKFRREGMGIFPEELLHQTGSELPPPPQLPGQLTPSAGSEIDQQVEGDVSGEESISPAAEVKPEQNEGKKVKSKQDKPSNKVKKEKKSPAAEAKSGKKAKKKMKSKKYKASKKKKKGKKKGKKKQAKKTKKGKKKDKKSQS